MASSMSSFLHLLKTGIENLKEVTYLLGLIREFLTSELDNFHAQGGVLHCVGDISRFSENLQKVFKNAEEKTSRILDLIFILPSIMVAGRKS